MAQMGFFALSDRYASLDAKRDPLVEIDAIVPWEDFRPTLERVWRKPEAERKSRAGRKPMDAVVMFKTLVLGALYNLSDDQIEYQVRDQLSFMRVLRLGLEDRVPDAKTVWLYREGLAQAGVVEALFRQFDSYLARQGNTSAGVWADPAYRSEEIEAKLRARGLKSRIHRKGKRGKPLSAQGKASNRTKSTARARVEHVFGVQTNDMGGTLVRTVGMARAKTKIGMKNLAYNMRRLTQLRRLNPSLDVRSKGSKPAMTGRNGR